MITGKNIATAVFDDLESFFYRSAKFRLKREFNQNNPQHISYAGNGPNARIKISKDFCEYSAENLSDLFFIMISLCHECAHYLNKHNEHDDVDEYDVKAIETWADYFGARIFGTIITFGKNSQALMSDLHKGFDQTTVVNAIGEAIRKVYDTFYLVNTDERYPEPIDRVSIFNAGFTSFFYRIYGEVKKDFTVWVLLSIIRKSNLEYLYQHYEIDWEDQELLSKRVSQIHQKIQGYDFAITFGLKPQFIILLVTNYRLSTKEKRLAEQRLEKELEKMQLPSGK